MQTTSTDMFRLSILNRNWKLIYQRDNLTERQADEITKRIPKTYKAFYNEQ